MKERCVATTVVAGLLAFWSLFQDANADMRMELGQYFDLPRLHFVSFESGPLGMFAYLQPDCGHRFRVQVGSYVGRNDGTIVRMTATAINVRELVPDGQGGWLERARTLKRERSEPTHPVSVRYFAYEKNASGVAASIESGGCPRVRVQVHDDVGDDGERVDAIAPTQINLIQCVHGKNGSCHWVRRTAKIEKSP